MKILNVQGQARSRQVIFGSRDLGHWNSDTKIAYVLCFKLSAFAQFYII